FLAAGAADAAGAGGAVRVEKAFADFRPGAGQELAGVGAVGGDAVDAADGPVFVALFVEHARDQVGDQFRSHAAAVVAPVLGLLRAGKAHGAVGGATGVRQARARQSAFVQVAGVAIKAA